MIDERQLEDNQQIHTKALLWNEARDDLNRIIELALTGKRKSQNYLKKLWNNDWQTIKERINTGGSAWYVWYMDGINQHLINMS